MKSKNNTVSSFIAITIISVTLTGLACYGLQDYLILDNQNAQTKIISMILAIGSGLVPGVIMLLRLLKNIKSN